MNGGFCYSNVTGYRVDGFHGNHPWDKRCQLIEDYRGFTVDLENHRVWLDEKDGSWCLDQRNAIVLHLQAGDGTFARVLNLGA
jgi:hypothetical protein